MLGYWVSDSWVIIACRALALGHAARLHENVIHHSPCPVECFPEAGPTRDETNEWEPYSYVECRINVGKSARWRTFVKLYYNKNNYKLWKNILYYEKYNIFIFMYFLYYKNLLML